MQDQVGVERLLERGREGLDQLVRQLADEADRVGEQVAAPRDLERAGGRVERVEEPVAHADARRRSARSAASTCRRSCIRPARRSAAPRARAPRRIVARVALVCSSRRFSAAMRSRASRRSVSIWVSPGPLVPIRRPPRRSRWVHSPRMRARLYSSWASSTCSLPSADAAWSAKMSRMIAVRSITGTPSSCSRLRSWRGSSSSSQAIRFASLSCDRLLQLSELALAEIAVGVGPRAALGQLARHGHAGGAQQLVQLAEIDLVRARRRCTVRAAARAGCARPRRSGFRPSARFWICPRTSV